MLYIKIIIYSIFTLQYNILNNKDISKRYFIFKYYNRKIKRKMKRLSNSPISNLHTVIQLLSYFKECLSCPPLPQRTSRKTTVPVWFESSQWVPEWRWRNIGLHRTFLRRTLRQHQFCSHRDQTR
jgi:hypothetical protein